MLTAINPKLTVIRQSIYRNNFYGAAQNGRPEEGTRQTVTFTLCLEKGPNFETV